MKFNIFSIKSKVLILILSCIILVSSVVIIFIIPRAKSSVTKATEHNMQDIVNLSSLLIDDQVSTLGQSNVDSSILESIVGDISIQGVDSSYIYVVNTNKNFIYHPTKDKIGTEVFNTTISSLIDQIPNGNYNSHLVFHYTDENGVVKYAAYCISDVTHWVTVIVGNESDALAPINSLQNSSIFIILLCAVILSILGYIMARKITKPIQIMTTVISASANLDFTQSNQLLGLQNATDETGQMSRATYQMQESLREIITRLNEQASQLSCNAENLTTVTERINSASTDNSATSQELAASMEETSATATTIDSNMAHILDNTNEINRKSKQGLALAKEINERATDLNFSALSASNATREIYESIKIKTQEAINRSSAVDKVNVLATSIQNIADQTSLLSLNASIEAARVGEAGKGFAVVAGEIGNLATQSTNTVKEIMEIIEEVNLAVSSMSNSMQTTLDFLENKVMNDYQLFLSASEKYDEDARTVNSSMIGISDMAHNLENVAQNIVVAVSGITQTISEAAIGVGNVAEKTTDVVILSGDIMQVVESTDKTSGELSNIVHSFHL